MSEYYNIAIIQGDGIGPEIVKESIKVLDAVALKYDFKCRYRYCLMGGCAIDKTGKPLPQETIDICKTSDAVLLGAVGGPKWENLSGENRPESGLLGIRKALNLYANLRLSKVFEPLKSACPLNLSKIKNGIDVMVVRELTGGIYFGDKGRYTDKGEECAFDTEKYSKSEVERIAKIAFEMAQKRKKVLTSVDKANVLESSRLWRETVIEVSKSYPDVKLNHLYVDNCSMQLVQNPSQFDVIVTSNIFGDILSDEASIISGSIGMIPSASLGDGNFGLFEPVHGSAPDIANMSKANPLATILSVAMMLRYSLNQPQAAQNIENAVDVVLNEYRTEDIFEDGKILVTTEKMGDLIVKQMG